MNDELKKADEIVRALRCNDAPEEPDGMGCANKKCRYRDVDGACDIVSMCQDAADLIDSLTAQLAEATQIALDVTSKYETSVKMHKITADLLTASQRRERAAVEGLVHDCSTCGCYEKCTDEWFKSDMNEDRCSCSDWQWRGPQAGKGEAK